MYKDFQSLLPVRTELMDLPIVFNLRTSKKVSSHSDEYVLASSQMHLIEHIEIKGIKRKETLFNSKECLLGIRIGEKFYGHYTLQLFHWNKKKESYVYDLRIPLMIAPLQRYSISIDGVDGNIIVILHGKRARPLQ